MTSAPILQKLSQAPYGVYAVDMRRIIVNWNAVAEQILGHTAEQAIGRRCYEVLKCQGETAPAPDCSSECVSVWLAQRNRVPPVADVLAMCASGQRKLITATPIILEGGLGEQTLLAFLFHEAKFEHLAQRVKEAVEGLLFPSAPASNATLPEVSAPIENPLTVREQEVVRLLAGERDLHDIAEALGISYHTVRSHLASARNKLGVQKSLELVLAVQRMGLI